MKQQIISLMMAGFLVALPTIAPAKQKPAKEAWSGEVKACETAAMIALNVRLFSGVITTQTQMNKQSMGLSKQCLSAPQATTASLNQEIHEYRTAKSQDLFEQANKSICDNYVEYQQGLPNFVGKKKSCTLDSQKPADVTPLIFQTVREIDRTIGTDQTKWRNKQQEILRAAQEKICGKLAEIYNETRTDVYTSGALTTFIPENMAQEPPMRDQCRTAPTHTTDALLKIMNLRPLNNEKPSGQGYSTQHETKLQSSVSPR